MIEIHELISLVNSTKYLNDSLVNHGCRKIKNSRFNIIKRKFSIKKLNENNIFKSSIKINHNFSENLIMALGDNNAQCIYHADDSLHRDLLQDWLNMRLCVNSIIKIIIF